jgi:hypothetical protein
MENYNLTNTLSLETITYEKAGARIIIDLCLTIIGLVDRVIKSEVNRGLDHDSDHFFIIIILDLKVTQLIKELIKK